MLYYVQASKRCLISTVRLNYFVIVLKEMIAVNRIDDPDCSIIITLLHYHIAYKKLAYYLQSCIIQNYSHKGSAGKGPS